MFDYVYVISIKIFAIIVVQRLCDLNPVCFLTPYNIFIWQVPHKCCYGFTFFVLEQNDCPTFFALFCSTIIGPRSFQRLTRLRSQHASSCRGPTSEFRSLEGYQLGWLLFVHFLSIFIFRAELEVRQDIKCGVDQNMSQLADCT